MQRFERIIGGQAAPLDDVQDWRHVGPAPELMMPLWSVLQGKGCCQSKVRHTDDNQPARPDETPRNQHQSLPGPTVGYIGDVGDESSGIVFCDYTRPHARR